MTKPEHTSLTDDRTGGARPHDQAVWLLDIAGAYVVGANLAGRQLWGLSAVNGADIGSAGKGGGESGGGGEGGDSASGKSAPTANWSDIGWPLDKATPALARLEEQRALHASKSDQTLHGSDSLQTVKDDFELTLVFWTTGGRLRRRFHGRFVDKPRPGLVMLTAVAPKDSALREANTSPGEATMSPGEAAMSKDAGKAAGTTPATDKTPVSPGNLNGADSADLSALNRPNGRATDVSQPGDTTPVADAGDAAVLREIARRIKSRITPRQEAGFVRADHAPSTQLAKSTQLATSTIGRDLDHPTPRPRGRQRHVHSFATAASEAARDFTIPAGSAANELRAAFGLSITGNQEPAPAQKTGTSNNGDTQDAGNWRPLHGISSWPVLADGSAAENSQRPGSPSEAKPEIKKINGERLEQENSKPDKLEQPQPETEMSKLVSKLAHELRTPLSAIHTAAEILESERLGPISNQRYKGYARDIHQSAAHALSVINAALDPGSMNAGSLSLEPTRVNLVTLIESAASSVTPLAAKADLEVVKQIDQNLPNVIADARCIKQMLLNLLTNAIKFTQPGGKIEVTADYDLDGPLRFTVSDSGPGMSGEQIAKIMDVKGYRTDQTDTTTSPHCSITGSVPLTEGDDTFKPGHAAKGMGYGLPLTISMARANGATLELGRSPSGGLSAAIVFNADRVAPVW